LGVVEFFDFFHEFIIIGHNEVDCHSLSSETSRSTNSMDILFLAYGEIVIDNQVNLLNIDTSSKKISGNENSGTSSSKFFHNEISLVLLHISVHGRNNEIFFLEFGGQFVNSSFGVAINNALLDFKVII